MEKQGRAAPRLFVCGLVVGCVAWAWGDQPSAPELKSAGGVAPAELRELDAVLEKLAAIAAAEAASAGRKIDPQPAARPAASGEGAPRALLDKLESIARGSAAAAGLKGPSVPGSAADARSADSGWRPVADQFEPIARPGSPGLGPTEPALAGRRADTADGDLVALIDKLAAIAAAEADAAASKAHGKGPAPATGEDRR